ncbi:MAG: NAD(+)/NADH kinase [Archangiaceae bacterium]|nr:NAD(+)/NADH kinase [Archangiaceae bacterium]
MKTLALVSKVGNPEAARLAVQLRERYPLHTFLAEKALAEELGWPAATAEQLAGSDLMITLGGDGTLIHAARLLKGKAVPILGINLGSLGFMTEVPRSEALAMVDQVVSGNFKTTSRMKLSCRVYRGDQLLIEDEVLNDLVINKGALARIADFETWMDGDFVATFKADGVIMSTPTGSTAYGLSAGGPIVHPSIDCVIITPICPHALTQKPIVVPGDQTIRIVLKERVDDVWVTIDGQVGQPLQIGDRIEVERSPNRVLLVRNPAIAYFGILRQKLRWGER